MEFKTKAFILFMIIVWGFFFAFAFSINLSHAHENEKHKHQVGTFSRYGGGFIYAGIYRTFVNAERTQCRDLIFTHDLMHVSEPFKCGIVDGGIKDLSQED
jgi:UDP-N-acetylmuramyl pentapeptide phosphotransferase/UDP-N-acetylglucosamine-1-phosphate transferase